MKVIVFVLVLVRADIVVYGIKLFFIYAVSRYHIARRHAVFHPLTVMHAVSMRYRSFGLSSLIQAMQSKTQ